MLKEVPLAKNNDKNRLLKIVGLILKEKEFQQYEAKFQQTKNKIKILEEDESLKEQILKKQQTALSIPQSNKVDYLDYLEQKYK